MHLLFIVSALARSLGTYFDALANLKRALKVCVCVCVPRSLTRLAFYSLQRAHKESGGLLFLSRSSEAARRCCCARLESQQKQWLVVFVLLFDELDKKFLSRSRFIFLVEKLAHSAL